MVDVSTTFILASGEPCTTGETITLFAILLGLIAIPVTVLWLMNRAAATGVDRAKREARELEASGDWRGAVICLSRALMAAPKGSKAPGELFAALDGVFSRQRSGIDLDAACEYRQAFLRIYAQVVTGDKAQRLSGEADARLAQALDAVVAVAPRAVAMKCACCAAETPSAGIEELGHLFVPLKSESWTEFHLLSSDRMVQQHRGIRISWFVCEQCAAKGHDNSVRWLWGFWIPAALVAVLASSATKSELIGPALLVFVVSLFIGFYCIGYWWLKPPVYHSRYCRDNMLVRSFESLRVRDDFVARYGSLKPSRRPFTRFSLDEL